MPESVTDRPTKAHEYVFLLTKGPRYFFDQEAVREGYAPASLERYGYDFKAYGADHPHGRKHGAMRDGGEISPNGAGRNVRSVWEIATQPYPEAHFATFPEALPERCIKAGCPEQVCVTCGKPRERITEKTLVPTQATNNGGKRSDDNGWQGYQDAYPRGRNEVETLGWSDCGHGDWRPGVVLDPFMGSGTVALVARRLGRRSVGVELSESYAELCARRLQQLSLLAEGSG